MQSVSVGGAAGTLSASGKYLILNGDIKSLYVRSNVATPHYCAQASDGATVDHGGSTYRKHKPVRRCLADCLHTAEEIIWGQALTQGQIRSKVGDEDFGDTDEANIEIATANAAAGTSNNGAHPGVNQAYVIVARQEDSSLRYNYPYHAAGVIALDGDDTVTMEVFATAQDAAARDQDGDFRMYDRGSSSFHRRWSAAEAFRNTLPVTMVLVKKT